MLLNYKWNYKKLFIKKNNSIQKKKKLSNSKIIKKKKKNSWSCYFLKIAWVKYFSFYSKCRGFLICNAIKKMNIPTNWQKNAAFGKPMQKNHSLFLVGEAKISYSTTHQ